MTKSLELTIGPETAEGRPGYHRRIREAFREHLGRSGLRLTGQRSRILDHLLAADRHLALDEIYRALRQHGIGRVTVFRTLKLLEEAGLADHVTPSRGAARFEMKLARPHHDHLICMRCGEIQEVRWPALERIQEKICRGHRFRVLWHRHEVFGLCGRCGAWHR